MWTTDQIFVEIADVEHPVVEVVVITPVGTMSLLASVAITNRVLFIDRAHVGGLKPGALGRTGLNAIGRKLMELADVDQIVVQGSPRTTGRTKGKLPRAIRFPR